MLLGCCCYSCTFVCGQSGLEYATQFELLYCLDRTIVYGPGRRKFILVGAIGMMISVGSMGIALAHAGIQKPVEKLCTETNTVLAMVILCLAVTATWFDLDYGIIC